MPALWTWSSTSGALCVLLCLLCTLWSLGNNAMLARACRAEHGGSLCTIQPQAAAVSLAFGQQHCLLMLDGLTPLTCTCSAEHGDFFGIGVSGYPEAHPDVIVEDGEEMKKNYWADIDYLKKKVG